MLTLLQHMRRQRMQVGLRTQRRPMQAATQPVAVSLRRQLVMGTPSRPSWRRRVRSPRTSLIPHRRWGLSPLRTRHQCHPSRACPSSSFTLSQQVLLWALEPVLDAQRARGWPRRSHLPPLALGGRQCHLRSLRSPTSRHPRKPRRRKAAAVEVVSGEASVQCWAEGHVRDGDQSPTNFVGFDHATEILHALYSLEGRKVLCMIGIRYGRYGIVPLSLARIRERP